jgi:hypothetical protein
VWNGERLAGHSALAAVGHLCRRRTRLEESICRQRTTAWFAREGACGWGEAMNAPESFDLTVSLSVLEHVKYLDPFLRASVAATRPGGTVVHRYDLGHSLYPATKYERLLVVVSRRMP